jgi:hypothetical protein
MTELLSKSTGESGGLYVGWDELNDLVSPKLGRDRFRALIRGKIDRSGFPPFRDEWNGFYWPSVRRWLDNDNRVGADDGVPADVQDGLENFGAAPRKKTGLQSRPQQPAVLVCETGKAGRSNGLPRSLAAVASGRDRR